MSEVIKSLQEKRNKLISDAAELLQAAEVSVESRTSADAMLAEVDVVEGDLTRLRRIEKMHAENREFERSSRPNVGGNASETMSKDERKAAFTKVFRTYARHGLAGVQNLPQEQRDLLTTSDATGGALIPQEFAGTLTEAMKFYGPIAGRVENKVTDNDGRPMKISFANDTANGLTLLATQGTSSPAETDPTFVSKLLGVDTVTGGLVKVSFQELEDSAFDLDAWLRKAFAIRYARGIEKAITLGVDSAGTALPNQTTGGLVAAATLGQTTAAISGGIGWDDLVYTLSALDPAYLGADSGWAMHSQTRNYLVGLKDGFGRPYFTPDPSGQNPFNKILGYDIVLNQSMAAPTAGAFTANQIPILFGDFKQGYMLRTDGTPSILRLNERYADLLEVGFYLYTRIGGTSMDAGTHPIVSLKIAAS